MALKVTQGFLCTGYYHYYPVSSTTSHLRKRLTQSWCKLVQNHRSTAHCDPQQHRRFTCPTNHHLSYPSPNPTKPSPPSPTEPFSRLSTSTTPTSSTTSTPLFDNGSSCPFHFRQQNVSHVSSSELDNEESMMMSSGCPFSGSKDRFPSSSERYQLISDDQCLSSSFSSKGNSINSSKVNHHYLHHPHPNNSIIYRESRVKSFHEIPTPKSYPIVGTTLTLLANGGASRLHEYCDSRHKELGPIYREKLGPAEFVFIADSKMVQKVYSNEGRFPVHLVPEAWTVYNELTGIKRGLFFMDGPEWENRRKGLNKIFLSQSVISGYNEAFNQVVTDVIAKWSNLLSDEEQAVHLAGKAVKRRSGLLNQLERELYNWSIESLGTMIFGRRLGCVETSTDLEYTTHRMEKVHLFVQCIQQLFIESAKMTILPARLAQSLNLPVWQRFMESAGQALNLARGYVEDNLAASNRNEQGKKLQGALEILLNQLKLDQEELIRIIVDLFLAAADTTSHATQWALYLLSKHPEYQEKILTEVESVVGKNGQIKAEHLKHFTMVKGVIKETLRLYPVAPFINRILDRDIVLGGYHIPANKAMFVLSLYTTSRDEQYWPDARSFKPERWSREETSTPMPTTTTNRKIVNSHASLPFGFGIRSCIGRRVAEVQMQFLLSRVIQKFHLQPGTEKDIGIKLRMITAPESPVSLRLIDRSSTTH